MQEIETVAAGIVDAAIKVHRFLGPGLLESTYQQCHALELRQHGYAVQNEVALPIQYAGQIIEPGYRIDTLVENLVIVEHKTAESLLPIHEAQLLTYLKLSGLHLGFLINWNVPLIKNGIKRMVYQLPGAGKYPRRPSQ